MKIKVKLYASFREIVGAKEQDIEVPDGTTVQMLLEEYIKKHPQIGRFREHVILSVNIIRESSQKSSTRNRLVLPDTR